jgi:hypothetical protein
MPKRGGTHRTRLAAVDEVVGSAETATRGVARSSEGVLADHRGTDREQPVQALDASDRLVGRQAHDERQLHRVHVAEPGHIALIEERSCECDVRCSLQASGHHHRVRRIDATQVRAQMIDQFVLPIGRQGSQQRHIDTGETSVGEPELDAPPPLVLLRCRADEEASVHQEVCMQAEELAGVPLESDEQVLAEGFGTDECGSGEVEADEAWIAGDRTGAALPAEPFGDPVGEPSYGVALRHPDMMPVLRRVRSR